LYLDYYNGQYCEYCHDIGFDSLGNVVLRQGNGGFTLNIVPFGTIRNIVEENPEQTFTLNPNPSGDNPNIYIYSDAEQTYAIAVHNTIGQLIKIINVQAVKGQNYVPLDLKNLTRGMYVMSIQFGNKTLSRTFAK
jgi:hypothetical protein